MLLKFDEEPCYGAYRELFEPVTGEPAARPIQLLSPPRPASSAKVHYPAHSWATSDDNTLVLLRSLYEKALLENGHLSGRASCEGEIPGQAQQQKMPIALPPARRGCDA